MTALGRRVLAARGPLFRGLRRADARPFGVSALGVRRAFRLRSFRSNSSWPLVESPGAEPALDASGVPTGREAARSQPVQRSRRDHARTSSTRWLEAVTARPLDRPVPFPVWARPLVRAVAGTHRTPLLTSGAATRAALRSAGVTAAAWGGAVHLPRAPRETAQDLETIAHEVAHAVAGRAEPSFFEGAASDPSEAEARAVGRTVRAVATSFGASPALARRTAAALGANPAAVLGAKPAARRGRAAAPPLTSPRGPGAGSSLRVQRFPAVPAPPSPSTATPGLPDVRSLPVSGAPVPVVRRSFLDSAVSSVTAGAHDATASARAAASAAGGSLGAAASNLVDEAASAGAGALSDARSGVTGMLDRAQSAGTDALGALGGAGAVRDPAGQLGHLLEALEERVVAELERRGGRYAGAF